MLIPHNAQEVIPGTPHGLPVAESRVVNLRKLGNITKKNLKKQKEYYKKYGLKSNRNQERLAKHFPGFKQKLNIASKINSQKATRSSIMNGLPTAPVTYDPYSTTIFYPNNYNSNSENNQDIINENGNINGNENENWYENGNENENWTGNWQESENENENYRNFSYNHSFNGNRDNYDHNYYVDDKIWIDGRIVNEYQGNEYDPNNWYEAVVISETNTDIVARLESSGEEIALSMEYHLERGTVLPRFELNQHIHYSYWDSDINDYTYIESEVIGLNEPENGAENGHNQYSVDIKRLDTDEVLREVPYENLLFIH